MLLKYISELKYITIKLGRYLKYFKLFEMFTKNTKVNFINAHNSLFISKYFK